MLPSNSDPLEPPAAVGELPEFLSGHGLCGAVTITVAGTHDPRVGACHCLMCQRGSGGLFVCLQADASAVKVKGEVTRYRSSAFAERAFCSRCGSHLWFNDVEEGGQPSRYDLVPGCSTRPGQGLSGPKSTSTVRWPR